MRKYESSHVHTFMKYSYVQRPITEILLRFITKCCYVLPEVKEKLVRELRLKKMLEGTSTYVKRITFGCLPDFFSFKHSKDITRLHYFHWCDSLNTVSFLNNSYHWFERNKKEVIFETENNPNNKCMYEVWDSCCLLWKQTCFPSNNNSKIMTFL